MHKNTVNLTNQSFGYMTVLRQAESIGRKAYWVCLCSCGSEKVVRGTHLVSASVQSCGCQRSALISAAITDHGATRSSAYRVWSSMIQRCSNPKNARFHRYGGRGIAVCDRWLVFKNFLADMGQPPSGLTLDRRDNDGPYSPKNCRWATNAEQMATRAHPGIRARDSRGRIACIAGSNEEGGRP